LYSTVQIHKEKQSAV